ncbi:unnamed protein product [Rotaria socialis]|uniref:Glycosyltransferase 61 catalytic domain-containing protein n=1 Tax=Rotaria socialis TaxID=392032 RepID=A0A817UZA3_9BILA|nr:unnamed protein product [Rotaria socialis]CAF4832935.1 unnamed protein product [Rotaria socialis]
MIHQKQRAISPFPNFNNLTFTVRKATVYAAAFLIATDAVAHSSDGSVLVLTCTRVIAVIGCSTSNISSRLKSKFPTSTNNCIGPENVTASSTTIISVNKLVILAHTWYNAFYHLTTEAISRLMILHELILFDPDIYILLQYPVYTKSAKELLELLGIADHRVIYYSSQMEGSTLFRANIIFIPRGINCGGAPPGLLEQIHVKALSPSMIGKIPPKPYLSLPLPTAQVGRENTPILRKGSFRVKNGPIILISRSITRSRRIHNEIDILRFLAAEYTEIPLVIFYGNNSLVDTIALFNSARVLVAPHGAGQVHILWMRPGTVMIEISPRNNYNGCYQAIATYRQILTVIYIDATATAGSALKVDMKIFKDLFNQAMIGRY